MKSTIVLALFSLFISNVSFAEEVATECPWMREDTTRSNPKANNTVKEKPKSDNSSAVQQ